MSGKIVRATVSRRRAIGLVAAAAVFDASALSRAGAQPATPHADDAVILIRHAEKASGDAAPFGVDEDGRLDPDSLTVRGWMRAGALAAAFAHIDYWNIPVPTAVYASKPRPPLGLRAAQTARPIARRLGLEVDTSFARGSEAALAATLVASTGIRLIVWEHHSIPAIVEALGPIDPTPPTHWDGDRYDVAWIFTRDEHHRWHFRSLSQHLLSGDE